MSVPAWGGRRAQQVRAVMARRLPCPCARGCGTIVTAETPWVVGHIKSRLAHPELTWEPSNWQVECKPCSDGSANEAVAEKALHDAGFSPRETRQDGPACPPRTHGGQSAPVVIREGLSWASFAQAAPAWLEDVLELPEDASPPLAITPVHPEATGTYGAEAVVWMEEHLLERGRPLRLRWWQKLGVYVQLQHRADGSLCFRTMLESTPRQVGKSARLRSVSLWRLAVGPSLFEPEQLIVHTGRSLSIVREVVKAAWSWAGAAAQSEAGWSIRKGMTDPEIAYQEVNRWIPRSKDDGTGYSPSYVPVDEAWDVKPETVDDDLEPSTVARLSPQVHLVSTAHRRATSLMRGRISTALAGDDDETLLLWWGTPPGADIADRSVWRAASPYWDAAREKLMEAAYLRAEAGEADPEADDMSPMDAFRCQWLNQWPLREKRVVPGRPLVTPEDWQALFRDAGKKVPPAAVAVESWPGAGVSVVAAWRLEDGRTLVSASAHPDVADAAAAARVWGSRAPVLVGGSLMADPAFKGMRLKAQTGTVVAAVTDLARWIDEGVLVHDGGEHLGVQLLGMRTKATPTGLRVVSAGAADALKAASWAVAAARMRRSGSGGRIILPSSVSA